MAQMLKHIIETNENEKRNISLLDGDEIRLHLSKGLGFSKEDRSTNVRRIGYVASEIVKHNGIALCSNIAPYQEDRDWNKTKISSKGNYIEIFVNASVEVCESRDVKDLYKTTKNSNADVKKSANDYEEPINPDLIVDTVNFSEEDNSKKIYNFLKEKKLI